MTFVGSESQGIGGSGGSFREGWRLRGGGQENEAP